MTEWARTHCSGIFDRLENLTPEQRAELFYSLETHWCWDCGKSNEFHGGSCDAEIPYGRPIVERPAGE